MTRNTISAFTIVRIFGSFPGYQTQYKPQNKILKLIKKKVGKNREHTIVNTVVCLNRNIKHQEKRNHHT